MSLGANATELVSGKALQNSSISLMSLGLSHLEWEFLSLLAVREKSHKGKTILKIALVTASIPTRPKEVPKSFHTPPKAQPSSELPGSSASAERAHGSARAGAVLPPAPRAALLGLQALPALLRCSLGLSATCHQAHTTLGFPAGMLCPAGPGRPLGASPRFCRAQGRAGRVSGSHLTLAPSRCSK